MLTSVQDIDIKLLRIFRMVVRHGGFAAAQTALNLSLPTISLQMKKLEERLGVRLCERGQAGFRLTEQGEGVMRATEQLFAAIDSYRNDIGELTRLPIGEARLGIIDNIVSNPACCIPAAIAAVRRSIEGMGITFFVGPPSELEAHVLAGTLDMAIGLFPIRQKGIEYQKLFDEEHCLYCSKTHPLFAEAHKVERATLQQHAYASWSYLEPYVSAKTGLKLDSRTGTSFMDGLACLILSGRYIGYLPRFFAQQWVVNGELRALADAQMGRKIEIFLIRRKTQRMKKVVAAMYEELLRAHRQAGKTGSQRLMAR